MDSSTSLAGGFLSILFGVLAVLTRKYSYEQAKKSWTQFGFPPWPQRLYETSLIVGGLVLSAFGIVCVAIAWIGR